MDRKHVERSTALSRDWKPSVIGFLLALLLSIDGCTGMMMGNSLPTKDNALTPDQIKAYQDMGQEVYGCLSIGGPPPAGNTVWIIVPKGSAVVAPKFGDGCHLLN